MVSKFERTVNKYGPIVLVFILLLASVYYFGILLNLQKMIIGGDNLAAGITFLSIYVILLTMVTWTFIKLLRTKPGHPKTIFVAKYGGLLNPPNSDWREIMTYLDGHPNVINAQFPGEYYPPFETTGQFCDTCDFPKPLRTFHCSICRSCVLRMDHHCPWVYNCVGFYNHKFYYQFLFYVWLLAIFAGVILLVEGIHFVNISPNEGAPYVFLSCAALAYFIFGACFFLWVYHTFLIWHNRTTIENIKEGRTSKWNVFMNRHSDKPSTYSVEDLNISPVFNFKYMLGDSLLEWLLPIGKSYMLTLLQLVAKEMVSNIRPRFLAIQQYYPKLNTKPK